MLLSSSNCQLLAIDKTNIAAVLPTLTLDDNIKDDITNAVNQNLTIRIPQSEMNYQDWTGIGYIKENPSTGEAGYMLSGMIAGGMTVIVPSNWVNKDLQAILSSPNTAKLNEDPLSASTIAKFTATDRQMAIVGTKLATDIKVVVVDRNKKRVKGAKVTFRTISGGGNFGNAKTTYETITGLDGTASVPFYSGTKTEANPGYIRLAASDQYITQIGINIISVTVKSRAGDISLFPPFEAYGTPDVPSEIKKIYGDGAVGLANNPAGSLVAKVVDKYGNPISNRRIKMKANSIQPRYTGTSLPPNPRGIEFYDKGTCKNPYPLHGDCPSQVETEVTTKYYGAIADAFFGDTVATKCSVEAADVNSNLLPAYFELFTTGFRAADNYIPPGVYLRYLQPVNDSGQPINASRVGTPLKAPLTAEFILMRDDVGLEGPASCSSGDGTCWNLSPDNSLYTIMRNKE